MGDKPILPEPDPTQGEVVRKAVADTAHYALTAGASSVSVRRVVLFLVVAAGVALALPIVALPALLLLALTDHVVA